MAILQATLLKDYPQYGKKAGDIINPNDFTIPDGGNKLIWNAYSIGIAKSLDKVELTIGTDVKLTAVGNGIKVDDFIKKENELGKNPEITPTEKPKGVTEGKSKPNWVLIGGIILVGYFLLKEK